MKTVKILGKTNLRSAQIAQLDRICDLQVFDSNVLNRSIDEVLSRAAHAEIALINAFTPIDRRAVEELSSLRSIVSCSAGIDHVDLAACRDAGIRVDWFPGYCAQTLAEKTLAYILMGLNRIVPAIHSVRAGHWDYLAFQGRESQQRVVAILGYGATGRIVRRLCESFGFIVETVNSKTSSNDVQRILARADIVTLHLALNSRTERYLREDTLRLLKDDVVIVNTARGNLINDRDLVEFLLEHPEATAFLDVLATEPMPPNSSYRQLQNAVVTPHIGWNSRESDELLADETMETLIGLIGQPAALSHGTPS
ncbi:NAD(P)-dependent oxidoreductase [Glycomyces harbinensis]|uniref:Glycerate dehydrogenase/D-3-phosphoglycerate dehydrogenase n=1 Tax=Glycomyces harbinensis TaxID=58114 RepID=A0A1G7B3N6_9ACTN|nr:NAD(P)-dependent oxidoreductase [Glycomyces harbinensis]SDE20845.1 glycerate dehydrogenase/D-3-phosphoglycerate dehydrogenase [Glycomyces harbinensis]